MEQRLRYVLLAGVIVWVYATLGYMALQTYARFQCLKWGVAEAVVLGPKFQTYCVVTAAGTSIPLPLNNMEFFARSVRQ